MRVGVGNAASHHFKYRIFARVAVNHRFEIFFYCQREVVGSGDGLLNGAGFASRQVGVAGKEKREQRQSLRFFYFAAVE